MNGLTILDVGHGNAAVLRVGSRAIVIDAGPGTSVLEYLIGEQVDDIANVIISHADSDHIKGLMGLIGSNEVKIDSVHLNSDAIKGTKQWESLVYELEDCRRRTELQFQVSLTEGDRFLLSPDVWIDILAPRHALAALGPGACDRSGRRVVTNTISAVARITLGRRSVLVTGDIDSVGLANLLETGQSLKSDILVFPHHGGRIAQNASVKNNQDFAQELLEAVRPSTVIFSIGRKRYHNPRPEIVAAVLESGNCHVMCTQMSSHCASESEFDGSHLSPAFAAGRHEQICCAGSIVISEGGMLPTRESHVEFITAAAPTALCRRVPSG